MEKLHKELVGKQESYVLMAKAAPNNYQYAGWTVNCEEEYNLSFRTNDVPDPSQILIQTVVKKSVGHTHSASCKKRQQKAT